MRRSLIKYDALRPLEEERSAREEESQVICLPSRHACMILLEIIVPRANTKLDAECMQILLMNRPALQQEIKDESYVRKFKNKVKLWRNMDCDDKLCKPSIPRFGFL